MMVKRGRPGIKPHIEGLIVSRVLEDRAKPRKEWTPRKALAFELQREIEGMGEPAPEQSTLEKRISDYSNKIKTPDPQEKPWSMATLDKYLIPSESLPVMLKVWKSRIEKGDGFTIREAKWAARWSAIITDPQKLSAIASEYARLELIYKLISWPFDSTLLDQVIMGVKREQVTDFRGFIPWIPIMAAQEDGAERLQGFIKDLKEYNKGGTK